MECRIENGGMEMITFCSSGNISRHCNFRYRFALYSPDVQDLPKVCAELVAGQLKVLVILRMIEMVGHALAQSNEIDRFVVRNPHSCQPALCVKVPLFHFSSTAIDR